jgi:hypothetical protein
MENDAHVVGPDAPTANSRIVKPDVATAGWNPPTSGSASLRTNVTSPGAFREPSRRRNQHSRGGSPIIRGNTIVDNSATSFGGGTVFQLCRSRSALARSRQRCCRRTRRGVARQSWNFFEPPDANYAIVYRRFRTRIEALFGGCSQFHEWCFTDAVALAGRY